MNPEILLEYLPQFESISLGDLPFQGIVLALLIILIIFGSACVSASISEYRLHGIWLHFFLGLLIPVIYPLLISFTMKVKEDDRSKQEEKEKKLKESTITKEGAPKIQFKGQEEKETTSLEFSDLNEAYFKSIYLDEDGEHKGPFNLDVDGNIVKAESIIDVQAALIIVETITREGKTQKLRIPYDKIQNCEEE